MGTSKFNAEGNPAMDLYPIQGGVEILLWSLHVTVTGDKRWAEWATRLVADFTLHSRGRRHRPCLRSLFLTSKVYFLFPLTAVSPSN